MRPILMHSCDTLINFFSPAFSARDKKLRTLYHVNVIQRRVDRTAGIFKTRNVLTNALINAALVANQSDLRLRVH